jgi:hypothetical protein
MHEIIVNTDGTVRLVLREASGSIVGITLSMQQYLELRTQMNTQVVAASGTGAETDRQWIGG